MGSRLRSQSSVAPALRPCSRSMEEGTLNPSGILSVGSARYDQKLFVRAAHVLQGLGPLPPFVPGDFTAGHSRHRLERLGYRVVPKLSKTDENLEGPSAIEPLARWLIGAAGRDTTIAYSDAASRLEKECGFSPHDQGEPDHHRRHRP